MLSGNPRQPRIPNKKMDRYLLPFVHVHSMKSISDEVRMGRKVSRCCNRIKCNESSVDITSPTNSPRHATPKTESSDPCRCINNQKENRISDHQSTSANGFKSEQKLHNEITHSSKILNWGNYSWSGHGLWISLLLSLLFVCADCQTNPNQCLPGLKTPGRTSPQGDIVLEHNDSLRIYCMLNEGLTEPKFVGKNASDLVFFRNHKEMEPEYTTIINSTTILLYVEKLVPSDDMYFCRLKLNNHSVPEYEAVCLNKVVVGFRPQEPRDFKCISYNWQKLVCTWNPEPNPITTHFFLLYKLPGRAGGRFTRYPCPVPKTELPPNTCLWDLSTDPIYRQVSPSYTFIMNIKNVLGEITVHHKFNHWAYVIPAEPVNFTVVNKTYCSTNLYWSVPYSMRNFPAGLFHRITYQSQYDSRDTWKSIDIRDKLHVNHIYFNLTNLQYANAVYDIRVDSKSANVTDSDKWSNFSVVTVKTAATLPGLPPRTDIGSFEIAGNSENRDVYIYWQTIPTEFENGANFTYQVVRVEENGRNIDIEPSEKTKTYAKFSGISFESFKFEIVTTNCQGANNQKALVRVPRNTEKPPEPAAFTKIAFEDGLYELSWIPTNDSKITNYTIFWCENDRDRPYQCTGYLDWVHVPRNMSIYNYTVPDPQKIYQFAIAANTAHTSSGMVWAACTAIHNKVIGKMKSVWINTITSDKIQVGWKLECSDRIDIIEGFVIYYCPIVSPYNLSCKYPMMNATVKGNPHTMNGDLVGLKPYTTYQLTVAVLTKNGEGHHSDPLYNTTLEAAPTEPQGVTITNVTNTTITIEWQPPVAMNGLLRDYIVYVDENSTCVKTNTSLQIQNLEPHREYKISVTAKTVVESRRSRSIVGRTLIGVPGKIDIPTVLFTNSSQVKISWRTPKHAGGNLDFYEIITTNDTITTNITKLEKELAIPDCNGAGREQFSRFHVRAVNLGNNGERIEGPWSDAGEGNCYISGLSSLAWVLIWIIGCLSGVAFLLFLGYSSKRIWIKCKAMQDVEVKLPPGLQPNVKLLGKGSEQHTQQHSTDSSGCSSGQESVTSSLTSDSHVSTDSGADLDPVPMSPTKLLESPPTWESSNLRQRIVTGATKPDSSSDRGRWDPYVKVAKTTDISASDSVSLARSTPNLTVDGNATTAALSLYPSSQQEGWSSTGYISMPSSEEDSSSNPSPLLRGKGSAQGVYSVVGLAPSPMSRVRTGIEFKGTERMNPQEANLIPIGTEPNKETITVNPYVSLASLDQKMRNVRNPQTSSLQDLADMGFSSQVSTAEQPPPYSISDKLSKPYVLTGLMDATKLSRPSTEHEDPDSQKMHCVAPIATKLSGGRPPFAPNFVNPSLSLSHSQPSIKTSPNIYVPVDTARGSPPARIAKDPMQTQNPYVAVSTFAPSSDISTFNIRQTSGRTEDSDEPSVSLYPFSPQITETSDPEMRKLVSHDDSVTRSSPSAATLGVVKQTSGYVTIAENPSRLTDNPTFTNSYVPHQRVNKKSPPLSYQPNTGQTDEQYSKVTVVPTTTT